MSEIIASENQSSVMYIEKLENKYIVNHEVADYILQLEEQNKEMLKAIKASCEYDESWVDKEKLVSNYYEGDPDIERYKIFKKIIKEQGE